jgi:hypothetical protein
MTVALVDFAVVTIFAREFLEGSIIVGQYRSMVLLGGDEALHPPGTRVRDALRAITLAALLAAVLALLVLACAAIPLAVLSKSFDPTTGEYIEGSSKCVAAVSLLILSLKIPRFLGVYGKRRGRRNSQGNRRTWKGPSYLQKRQAVPALDAALPSSFRRQRSFSTPETQTDAGEGVGGNDESDVDADVESRADRSAVSLAVSGLLEAEAGPVVDTQRHQQQQQQQARRVRNLQAWWRPNHRRETDSRQPDDLVGTDVNAGNAAASLLTLREIKFNVAWNLWREVAECGAFLLPFFLTGNGTTAIPLSAVIGGFLGVGIGCAVYAVNRRYQKNRAAVCVFATLLMVFFSAGLFTDACHIFEEQLGKTRQVWHLSGRFWDAHALPMTLVKPFGYDDSRTVLEMASYWLWLALTGLLHYHWYRTSPRPDADTASSTPTTTEAGGSPPPLPPVSMESTASSPSLAADAVDADDDGFCESTVDEDTGSVNKEVPSRISCATTAVETDVSILSGVDTLDVEVGHIDDRDLKQSPLSIDI